MSWILDILNYGLLGLSLLAVLFGLMFIPSDEPNQLKAQWITNLLLGGILFTLLSDKLFK